MLRDFPGNPVVKQWVWIPIQGVWVQSLVGKQDSRMPPGQKKDKHNIEAVLQQSQSNP